VTDDKRTESVSASDALTAHRQECDACQVGGVQSDDIVRVLSRSVVELDAPQWSARTVDQLRPVLWRRARAVWWRQVAIAVLLALVPLPLVVAYDSYFLQLLHTLVCAVVPTAFATYLVVSYAAFLVLLFATTYAAIPLILARSNGVATSAHG